MGAVTDGSNAWMSGSAASHTANFAGNAWYEDFQGHWTIPNAGLTSGRLEFEGLGTVTFWQTQTAGGTDWAERLVILPGGNVGIGTSVPGFLLDVNGTARCLALMLGPNTSQLSGPIKDGTNTNTLVDTGGCYYAS